MRDNIDSVLDRLVERGGNPFHEVPAARGPAALLRHLFGLPPITHYYERLDGKRIYLTSEEASQMAPIELELGSKKIARQMMLERRRNMNS